MATHSSILAWRIPWTEEPGGLQSMVHKESDMTEQRSTYTNSFSWTVLLCPFPIVGTSIKYLTSLKLQLFHCKNESNDDKESVMVVSKVNKL